MTAPLLRVRVDLATVLSPARLRGLARLGRSQPPAAWHAVSHAPVRPDLAGQGRHRKPVERRPWWPAVRARLVPAASVLVASVVVLAALFGWVDPS